MRKTPERSQGGATIRFEDLETNVRRTALRIAAQVLERTLNADTSDYRGPARPCSCGAIARYRGRRTKTFMTVVGELNLDRAYYYCPTCKHGFCPRDTELSLDQDLLSPGVQRMVGTVAASVSFQESGDLLRELAGLSIETKHIERTAESLGKDIAEDEKEHVLAQEPASSTMYLGMDGTGIPMRAKELAGREGKQENGSSKTREVKLVTVWTANGHDAEGVPMRDVGSVSYNAAIESAAMSDTDALVSDFALRVQREAERRGFDSAQRKVIIGDGARWIWNMADELFPGAIQIVDLYHAKGTVSEVAKVIFGISSEIGLRKAKQWRDDLEAGNIDRIIGDLEVFRKQEPASETCIKYLQTNRQRMRYPEFKNQGLCTSSGVVEAGCKWAIGARLKRAGMHWTISGANAIIALRASRLSARFDDYWTRRATA